MADSFTGGMNGEVEEAAMMMIEDEDDEMDEEEMMEEESMSDEGTMAATVGTSEDDANNPLIQRAASSISSGPVIDVSSQMHELEIESLISGYKGTMRGIRLDYLMNHLSDSSSCRDVVNLLHSYVLDETLNVPLYRSVLDIATSLRMSHIHVNQSWIDEAKRKTAEQLSALSLGRENQNYETVSLVDAMRRNSVQTSTVHLTAGDFDSAYAVLFKIMDHNQQNILRQIQHYILMAEVSVFRDNWSDVGSNCFKLRGLFTRYNVLNSSSTTNASKIDKTRKKPIGSGMSAAGAAASGLSPSSVASKNQDVIMYATCKMKWSLLKLLAALKRRCYQEVIEIALELNVDELAYPELVTAHSVLTYTVLCIIATSSRQFFNKNVAQNVEFRQFLELDPVMKECLQAFQSNNYSKCFEILRKLRPIFLLDKYLVSCVDDLFSRMLTTAFVAYVMPFSRCDLNKMANVFQVDIQQLVISLQSLILTGKLNAKIDIVSMILEETRIDERRSMQSKVAEAESRANYKARLTLNKAMIFESQITALNKKSSSASSATVSGSGAVAVTDR